MLALLGPLIAAGCSADGSDASPSSTAAAAAQIQSALQRLSADALDEDLQLTAIDHRAVGELVASGSPHWPDYINQLGQPAAPTVLEKLKVDMSKAVYTVSAGQAPRGITIIHGGQDAAAISAAAKSEHYSGDDVLTATDETATPVSLHVAQIRAQDGEVVIADPKADIAWVDGEGKTLADAKGIPDILACLGDVPFVVIAGEIGVGAREQDGSSVAVVCTAGDQSMADSVEKAVAEGKWPARKPYSEYFSDASTEVLGSGQMRLVATFADQVSVHEVVKMLAARALPGLGS